MNKNINGGILVFLVRGWKWLRYERWTATGRGTTNRLHCFKLGRVKIGFGWVPRA